MEVNDFLGMKDFKNKTISNKHETDKFDYIKINMYKFGEDICRKIMQTKVY